MLTTDFNPWQNVDGFHPQMFDDKSSELVQWPIKLWKIPIPWFNRDGHAGGKIQQASRAASGVNAVRGCRGRRMT